MLAETMLRTNKSAVSPRSAAGVTTRPRSWESKSMRQSELGEHESAEPDELYKDEEWLRERWFADMPATEIAEEAGCGRQTIRNWALDFGFPPKRELVGEVHPYRDEQWLRERWFSDMTVEEIVEEAGSSRASIHRWANRFGFPPKRETWPWHDPELLEEMYHEREMSAVEIAEQFPCSPAGIRGTMERHDIPRREPWEHLEKPSGMKILRRSGHECISFGVDGNTHYYAVHRLLAIAEFGLDEVAGKVVHHRNGIPWDNRPDNLELIESQSEHARMHSAERERDELGRYT